MTIFFVCQAFSANNGEVTNLLALSPDDSIAVEASSVVFLLSFSSMVVPCSSLPLDVDAVDDIFTSMLSLVVVACPGPTPDEPVFNFSSC